MFAVKFFTTRRVIDSASALTYSTMLSLVPICAVVFSVARGFGYTIYIELWFRNALSSQPQVAELLIDFVNSYLEHAKNGLILGIGFVFMLYTIIMLSHDIEQTFNDIWHVENRKSFMSTFTGYVSTFFLIPFVIIVMSGVSLFVGTIASHSQWDVVLGPMMQLVVDLLPFVIMWMVFVGLYVLMPNTKVKVSNALVPGLFATIAMHILQWFYINAQMFISNYNAIYGSFAALPLFMLWVQFSWTICLFGAELSYTNQNLEDFSFINGAEQMSHRYKILISLLLLSRICKRFDAGQQPLTATDLQKQTSIPLSITRDMLNMMVRANLLTEIEGDKATSEARFQPALSLDKITVGHVIDVLDAQGNHNFSIDLKATVNNVEAFHNIIKLRKDGMEKLDTYQVKDL